jgi:hypothetical protein
MENLTDKLARTNYNVVTIGLQDHKAITLLQLVIKELNNLKADDEQLLGKQMQLMSIKESIEMALEKI